MSQNIPVPRQPNRIEATSYPPAHPLRDKCGEQRMTASRMLHHPRASVMSRTAQSAAIHPDINAIGIPAPGCAAPPAR